MNPFRSDLKKLRQRYVLGRIWVPAFMMLGISLLSGTAGVQMGSFSFVGVDKVGHFVVFGLLGIAWCRCVAPCRARWTRLCLAILLTTGFGLLDELQQFHNPERYFEWADLLADACGAITASALYTYIMPLQQLLELDFRRSGRLPFKGNQPEFAE